MGRIASLILGLIAVPVAFFVFSTVLGLGVLRQGPPHLVSLSATALLLIPPLGLASLMGRSERMGPAALLAWSVGVYLALPLYFPGERLDAASTGFAVVGSLVGVAPDPELVASVDAMAPQPAARALPPTAAEPAVRVLPPSQATLPDQVALPYEGRKNTLLLPIEVEATPTSDGEELWMLFDTGATLTTLTTDKLRDLGVVIPRDAPQITMHTAAGQRTARLVMVDRIWVGGFAVEGVTISVCDPCADDDSSGLLGLNVSGQFLVTLDTVRRELVLQPRQGPVDRTLDIQPWIEIAGSATRWPDGRTEVEVSVDNHADRDIEEVTVKVQCDRSFLAHVENIPARGYASTTVALPRGVACEQYKLNLENARW